MKLNKECINSSKIIVYYISILPDEVNPFFCKFGVTMLVFRLGCKETLKKGYFEIIKIIHINAKGD